MTFTTIPAAGAKLRGPVFNSLITELRPVPAVKTADEIVNNSSAFQNDDHLFVPLEANATYKAWLHLTYLSQVAAAYKFQFTYPAGTTSPFWSFIGSSPFTYANAGATGGVVGLAGTAADIPCDAWGLVIVGGTAGTMQMQWAQNVANASNTITRAGSYLTLERLS